MRLLIILLLTATLSYSQQVKKFVVVGATPANKISILGTGDSTQATLPLLWLSIDFRYNQRDSFPSVILGTYRTYARFWSGNPVSTDLPTSGYSYRGTTVSTDSIIADVKKYFIALGYNAALVSK